jgi:cytochrome b pre-mRNA-processing protein 3
LFAKAKGPLARPSLLSRFGRRTRERDALQPLYDAVVARARDPFWYREGQVPDTLDGRFDMLAAMMAIVLIRLETEAGEEAKLNSVLLTELFVEDMDESLHQIGIGDYVVGKHVGKMMSALGGRLGAFRQAAQDRDFAGPVRRNVFHDGAPSEAAVEVVAGRLERFDAALLAVPAAELFEGKLPPL